MGASDEACSEARGRMLDARTACLAAIANHYGHPVEACGLDVLAAVSAAIRAGFDLGAAFTYSKGTIPPPPPTDAEVLHQAERDIRSLRRPSKRKSRRPTPT